MFHWSSNFLMVFGAIAFQPISSSLPKICWDMILPCNNVTTARMCQKEEWCKKQAAVCDTIPILREASNSDFLITRRKIWGICRKRFMAYKKPKTNTAKRTKPVHVDKRKISCPLPSPCNSVFAAKLCQKEEWCEKQAAACNVIHILREATYFENIMLELRRICHNRFLSYKILERNTTEMPVPVYFDEICNDLGLVCNSVYTARMCEQEEWCKLKASSCDGLYAYGQYNSYFNNLVSDSDMDLWNRDFRKACHNKFVAYKKYGTDTIVSADDKTYF